MVLQIGTTIVLARLLSPTDYGLQAMVLTLTAFFALFKDAGLSLATVQQENVTGEQISTLFWINVALGSFLTLVVVLASPFLATFYKEPRLIWITIASSTIFLFNALGVQHKALLDRAMRFTTSVKIDVLTAVIGTVIAVGMAILGFGYWALICQNISLAVVGTVATWIAIPWVPGKPRWTNELRAMLRFGGTVTLNGLVVYIAYNTEKVLLGRYWGAAPLGIYGRAYQLATLPVTQLINAVYVVAFSVLSRMQSESDRLQRAFLKSQSVILAVTIPVVVSSAIFGDELVAILLGPKWSAAAPVLRLLAPTVLVLALVNPFSWLLQSTGFAARSLKIALLIAPVVILGVVAGLHNGPAGVALGYSAAMLLLFVPIVVWARHGTGITVAAYFACIKRPIVAGIFGGIAGWVARYFLKASLTPIPLLAVEVAAFTVVYVFFLLIVMGEKDFYLDLLKHLLHRRQAVPAAS